MKIILDCDPADMGSALNTVFRVQQQNPDQGIGRGNAITVRGGGVDFQVIRNQDSYTVKEV
jgi:hypothetical protein